MADCFIFWVSQLLTFEAAGRQSSVTTKLPQCGGFQVNGGLWCVGSLLRRLPEWPQPVRPTPFWTFPRSLGFFRNKPIRSLANTVAVCRATLPPLGVLCITSSARYEGSHPQDECGHRQRISLLTLAVALPALVRPGPAQPQAGQSGRWAFPRPGAPHWEEASRPGGGAGPFVMCGTLHRRLLWIVPHEDHVALNLGTLGVTGSAPSPHSFQEQQEGRPPPPVRPGQEHAGWLRHG